MAQNATKAEPRSKADIEDIVSSFRKDLNINSNEEVNILGILDRLTIAKDYEYEVLEDFELDGNIYAETDLFHKKIRMKKSVLEGAVSGNARDRFTIAHEIGHLVLHTEKIIVCRTTEKIKSFEDPEWQANQFAAELLIPKAYAKILSVEELTNKYKVSKEAATYRKMDASR